MRYYFSSHVYDEAWTSRVTEFLDALVCHYLYKLDMSVFFGDGWEVHVDEVAEFIAGLIEMENNEGSGVFICDFSDILISGYLHHLTIFL